MSRQDSVEIVSAENVDEERLYLDSLIALRRRQGPCDSLIKSAASHGSAQGRQPYRLDILQHNHVVYKLDKEMSCGHNAKTRELSAFCQRRRPPLESLSESDRPTLAYTAWYTPVTFQFRSTDIKSSVRRKPQDTRRPRRVEEKWKNLWRATRRATRRMDRAHLRHSLHESPPDRRVGAVVDEPGPDGGPASLALALEVVICWDVEVMFKQEIEDRINNN